jgi:transcriptional regulator with XRE-family HTH domain
LTAAEFKKIRHGLGLSVVGFGRALGYEGQPNTISTTIRRYECGMREIPPWIANLAYMYGKHGVPKQFLVDTDLDVSGDD